ncbi:MAG: hypothetical protein MJZ34_02780 [Paludibacteraceae bacterium]|nr:hypothetical protein [Paludibacteraceae bacterium]
MEALLNIDPQHTYSLCILLIVITTCLATLVLILCRFFKILKVQRVETKAGTLSFASPKDGMSLFAMDKEDSNVIFSPDDWSRHSYFNLLANLKTKGVKVECSSPVKAQFISEYMKIYCSIYYDSLLAWTETLVKEDGKGLEQVAAVMQKIEKNSLDMLRQSRVYIFANGKEYLVPIPRILIEKFTDQYSFTQAAGFDTLEMSLDSKYYAGWRVQLNCMLAQLYTITATNFIGMNAAIKTLNGELDHYFEDFAKNLN